MTIHVTILKFWYVLIFYVTILNVITFHETSVDDVDKSWHSMQQFVTTFYIRPFHIAIYTDFGVLWYFVSRDFILFHIISRHYVRTFGTIYYVTTSSSYNFMSRDLKWLHFMLYHDIYDMSRLIVMIHHDTTFPRDIYVMTLNVMKFKVMS